MAITAPRAADRDFAASAGERSSTKRPEQGPSRPEQRQGPQTLGQRRRPTQRPPASSSSPACTWRPQGRATTSRRGAEHRRPPLTGSRGRAPPRPQPGSPRAGQPRPGPRPAGRAGATNPSAVRPARLPAAGGAELRWRRQDQRHRQPVQGAHRRWPQGRRWPRQVPARPWPWPASVDPAGGARSRWWPRPGRRTAAVRGCRLSSCAASGSSTVRAVPNLPAAPRQTPNSQAAAVASAPRPSARACSNADSNGGDSAWPDGRERRPVHLRREVQPARRPRIPRSVSMDGRTDGDGTHEDSVRRLTRPSPSAESRAGQHLDRLGQGGDRDDVTGQRFLPTRDHRRPRRAAGRVTGICSEYPGWDYVGPVGPQEHRARPTATDRVAQGVRGYPSPEDSRANAALGKCEAST